MDELLTMSGKEVSRLEVMQRLKEKSLNQREAAKLVGVRMPPHSAGDNSNSKMW